MATGLLIDRIGAAASGGACGFQWGWPCFLFDSSQRPANTFISLNLVAVAIPSASSDPLAMQPSSACMIMGKCLACTKKSLSGIEVEDGVVYLRCLGDLQQFDPECSFRACIRCSSGGHREMQIAATSDSAGNRRRANRERGGWQCVRSPPELRRMQRQRPALCRGGRRGLLSFALRSTRILVIKRHRHGVGAWAHSMAPDPPPRLRSPSMARPLLRPSGPAPSPHSLAAAARGASCPAPLAPNKTHVFYCVNQIERVLLCFTGFY